MTQQESTTAPGTIRYEQSLARIDRYARLLDSQFRVPFTRIRFGLDPLIGLLPGIGDLAGFGLSLYLIVEAIKVGAGSKLVTRMLGNVLVEFVVGLVPVAGDAFDLFWRANDRNAAMLRAHLHEKMAPTPPRPAWRRWFWPGVMILIGIAVVAGLVVL
ncbi:uncharacterized protein DUF4112 [Tamilnaduibacter salinus]|uniref:Uncharacterized protein DUF4112 n=1 Tax=Tamilnaduibacter salinus TaxID=1484056 RepID=A0A2U1CVS5_9GAMM|nr:DUF4112 domain-containing protein [Tamilnaduibacter salinus]PVY75810.1 uncharacterized protein DUF4112 [Tamilnaduibacter salinus]